MPKGIYEHKKKREVHPKTEFKKGHSVLGGFETQFKKDSEGFRGKHTEETKEKMKQSWKLKPKNETEWKRVLKEKEELEKQGFRCIPIGHKVIPDIIAIKGNQVFAIEVEYAKPNYDKYTPEFRKFYDDIIWIIKKKVRSG